MNYLWILAFCLCGALATPVTEDESLPDKMATELDIVEERDDELVYKIEDEGEEDIMRGKRRRKRGNCFIDNSERILDPKTLVININMTPNVCNEICEKSNYKYFGVEFGVECFCGNEWPSSKLKVGMSECNMNCGGDEKQKCGASWRINISKTFE